jgi:hypothetical protein
MAAPEYRAAAESHPSKGGCLLLRVHRFYFDFTRNA